jgi:hypothetical protein
MTRIMSGSKITARKPIRNIPKLGTAGFPPGCSTPFILTSYD